MIEKFGFPVMYYLKGHVIASALNYVMNAVKCLIITGYVQYNAFFFL